MQSYNIQYRSKEDLQNARQRLSEVHPEKTLLQVFCGEPDETYILTLIDDLRAVFPEAAIVGTTTAGEIYDGESLDKTTVISITQFEHTQVQTALIKQNQDLFAGGLQLAKALHSPEIKLAILFGCGIKDGGAINGEPLLNGFQQECPEAVVVGGQAGDNGFAQKTFVFTEEGLTDSGVAAASLNGEKLFVDNRYNLSWVPLGKKMTITEAAATHIKTIDNRPAKEVYSHYLGDDVGDRLPHSAAEFPLVVERNGVLLARHANRVLEDGSLDFMAPFYPGEQVQFAFCHTDLVVDSARKLYDEFSKSNHQAIFIYSCLSRKWVLGQDSVIEIAPLASLAPTSGFFSYGEYFNSQGENMFLSQTMTVVALAEQSDSAETALQEPRDQYDFQEAQTKQNQDLQALHRLVETSAKEREELICQLKIALAEIKTLQGLIPICASCKNIRDDKGYWNEIDEYIAEHTEAQFSHGLCPGCAKELYPHIYKKMMDEKYHQERS